MKIKVDPLGRPCRVSLFAEHKHIKPRPTAFTLEMLLFISAMS